jgi:3-hydroxyacyl-[acyl-carrier-protein] dehydratase
MDNNETIASEPIRTLNSQEIQSILPHRYPFLLIDRIVEIVRLKRIVAIKSVSINEPFFQGHFPGFPIMPGALIVEAIAQAGGVLLLPEVPDRDKLLMVFTGIDRAKFRRPVTPGDQLRIEVDVLNWKPRATRLQGRAYVGGKLACEAVITCQLVPRAPRNLPGDVPGGAAAPAPETVDQETVKQE